MERNPSRIIQPIILCLLLLVLCLPGRGLAGEISRDGRFIDYDNGTVLDTTTNLMWAAMDNGSAINWRNAKRYCKNYRGGGYDDWRMPTLNELTGLYDMDKIYRSACGDNVHLTELIHLTCCCTWTSETHGSDAAYLFGFTGGSQAWGGQSVVRFTRALPVRSAK